MRYGPAKIILFILLVNNIAGLAVHKLIIAVETVNQAKRESVLTSSRPPSQRAQHPVAGAAVRACRCC